MHTIFVREHNRVANRLVSLFPRNNEEFYYQQARRVVIAKWQHIVYNEYLPVLLGPTLAARASAPRGIDPVGNPAIFTEFSTAAYRMGHSQLKSFIGYEIPVDGIIFKDLKLINKSSGYWIMWEP